MLNNGFIVQGNDLLPYIDRHLIESQHYRGIYSGITWPLDAMNDVESKKFSDEIFECRMKAIDNLYTSVDFEWIKRYIKNCNNLNIPTRCIMIESFFDNPHFESNISLPKTELLGYEFVATDMQASCSYEDLCDELFSPMTGLLNSNWVFHSLQDIQRYVEFRKSLQHNGFELEDYYFPRIVRLSEVYL